MQHLIGKKVRITETKKAFETHQYNEWETPMSIQGVVTRVIKGGTSLSDDEIENLYYDGNDHYYDRRIFDLFRNVKFNRLVLDRSLPLPKKEIVVTVNPLLWEVTEINS